MSPIVDPASLAAVRALPIDQSYLRKVIDTLTGIGSSGYGFRNTGTPEDAAVAAFVSAEMTAMGLQNVAIEDVEVDAWRFRSATVAATGGAQPGLQWDAVSFGGVPATPPGGITGRLVDVGDGRRSVTAKLDLAGALVLVDWRNPALHPSALVLEFMERGVLGMIVNCLGKTSWYQSPDALGAFDGHWPAGAPPMVLIRKEHASALRADKPAAVTMTLDVELNRNASGQNVVGYLPGAEPGPIIVGAHHDAWFQGAFDNTSGVAALLAMAKALVETGHRPRHTICFTTRTGEEYGIVDSVYDWCIGAWRQVQVTHPEWATEAPFHLCVEATGHRELRSVVEAPVELAAWSRRVCRAAEAQGWAPTGWRISPPVAGTEQWPLLVAGIPGVACYAWEKSFGHSDYHTQFDTTELLDFDYVEAQIRMYCLLLLEADRDPNAILDHRARARQLATIATRTDHAGLLAAASRHRAARGRTDFTSVGKGLFALDAHSGFRYPHEQTAADLAAIDAALTAIDSADLSLAARHLRKVGSHYLVGHLGSVAFARYNSRYEPAALSRTWGAASHLTPSPDLWQQIASLLGEPAAQPFGPWVGDSLICAREDARKQLDHCLNAMSRSV